MKQQNSYRASSHHPSKLIYFSLREKTNIKIKMPFFPSGLLSAVKNFCSTHKTQAFQLKVSESYLKRTQRFGLNVLLSSGKYSHILHCSKSRQLGKVFYIWHISYDIHFLSFSYPPPPSQFYRLNKCAFSNTSICVDATMRKHIFVYPTANATCQRG